METFEKVLLFLSGYPKWVGITCLFLAGAIIALLIVTRPGKSKKKPANFDHRIDLLLTKMRGQYLIYDREVSKIRNQYSVSGIRDDAEWDRRVKALTDGEAQLSAELLRVFEVEMQSEAAFLYRESCQFLGNCDPQSLVITTNPVNVNGYRICMQLLAQKKNEMENNE